MQEEGLAGMDPPPHPPTHPFQKREQLITGALSRSKAQARRYGTRQRTTRQDDDGQQDTTNKTRRRQDDRRRRATRTTREQNRTTRNTQTKSAARRLYKRKVTSPSTAARTTHQRENHVHDCQALHPQGLKNSYEDTAAMLSPVMQKMPF